MDISMTLQIVMAIGGVAAICTAVSAWCWERRHAQRLAERLIVEGRLEALTVQTLQAMHQVARDVYRSSP